MIVLCKNDTFQSLTGGSEQLKPAKEVEADKRPQLDKREAPVAESRYLTNLFTPLVDEGACPYDTKSSAS